MTKKMTDHFTVEDDEYFTSPARAARNSTRKETSQRPQRASWTSGGTPGPVRADRGSQPSTDSLTYRLADLFLTQPWVHTYRGATKPQPRKAVSQSRGLVAKIIADAIKRTELLEGRSEEKVESVVEYAMKHFFDRVPNDEAGASALINRFVHEDWWDGLIQESVDHWIAIHLPPQDFDEAYRRTREHIDRWPKPKRNRELSDKIRAFLLAAEARSAEENDYSNDRELTEEDCK